MRLTFLLDASRCGTTADFLIRDVPGTSGRLDVVCRILIATFRTVPQLCPALQFLAVCGGPPDPPLLLRVISTTSENIPESELALALIIKGLLQYRTTGAHPHPNWPQFSVARQDFKGTLQEVTAGDTSVYYLIEHGAPIATTQFDMTAPLVFVLGDHHGMPSEHEELLSRYQAQKLSIGKQSLLGSHVVTLVLMELARRQGLNL